MKNHLLYTFLLIFLTTNSSCSSETCKEDQQFKTKFDSCLQLIYQYEKYQYPIEIDKKLDAVLFLNAVTGIEGKINSPHAPVYDNSTELKKDIRLWKKWYEENKCNTTLEEAEKKLNKYNRGK